MTTPMQHEDAHLEAAYEDQQSGETFLQIPGAVEQEYESDYGIDEDVYWYGEVE